jgi:hypothetical protein
METKNGQRKLIFQLHLWGLHDEFWGTLYKPKMKVGKGKKPNMTEIQLCESFKFSQILRQFLVTISLGE